ncbi:MAG TPA: tetratricopeptide repeat protein [Stellaceae bacterium]|nr:tetratricopeptide repeat protein [Stellaceae bacterium]
MPSRLTAFGFAFAAALVGMHGADGADARTVAALSQTLAIEESRSGAASPQLLPLLGRLAGAQFDNGALGEATDSRRRALKIALRAYGGQSPKTVGAMVDLGEIELLRHRYIDAEPLLVTARSLLETRLGTDNPALIAPLAALARIALARGDLQAAETEANRAQTIALHHPTAQSSSEPLRVLGAIDAAQDRFDDGEKLLREAVARDRRLHGADSLETARSLAQLANLLLRAQRFDQALAAIEQATAIDQERLGKNHPLIADDFADLGLIYAGLGRDDAAADALGFAVDLLEQGAGEESTRLGYAELELAPVLRRLGQSKDAEAAFKHAKHILDKAAKDEREHERQI